MKIDEIKKRHKEAETENLAFKLLDDGDAEIYGTFMVTLLSQDELKTELRFLARSNPEFEEKLIKQLKSQDLTEWFKNEI